VCEYFVCSPFALRLHSVCTPFALRLQSVCSPFALRLHFVCIPCIAARARGWRFGTDACVARGINTGKNESEGVEGKG
jgi:hypothetical protein